MTNDLSNKQLALERIGIDPMQIKSIQPHWKRSLHRAIFNWITQYQADGTYTVLEQIRGYIEAFYHLCELENWQKAADLIVMGAQTQISLSYSNNSQQVSSIEELHTQIGNLGYYKEQIDIYNCLLHQATPEIDLICLNGLGLAYKALGQHEQSIQYHQQQLQLALEINNEDKKGQALCNLGNVYAAQRSFDRALMLYQQALEIALKTKNREFEGKIWGNFGVVYQLQGKYSKAIDYQMKHWEIAREEENKANLGNVFENLGICYYYLGNYQQAKDYFERSLIMSGTTGSKLNESIAFGSLGNVCCSLEEYSEALHYFQQQLELAREIGYLEGEAKALGNLGVFTIY